MRKILIAAGAIVLFGGAAMLVVLVTTRDSSQSSAVGAAADAAPDAPAGKPSAGPLPPLPPRGSPDLSALGTVGGLPSQQPIQTLPPPPKPPTGSWEAVARSRPRSIGSVGAAVANALTALQPEISACFEQESQKRYAQQHYSTTQDYAPLEDVGATILVLQVETLDGEAQIVDAPVETLGGASDGVVACAQQVLRGRTFPLSGAKPGARYRIVHNLMQ
jgi:hypothetical protein